MKAVHPANSCVKKISIKNMLHLSFTCFQIKIFMSGVGGAHSAFVPKVKAPNSLKL